MDTPINPEVLEGPGPLVRTRITQAINLSPLPGDDVEYLSLNSLLDSYSQEQWALDAEGYAEQATTLFLGQRKAREEFFREMWHHAAWREMPLLKPELTGAASNADVDARRWCQFVRLVYSRTEGVEPEDLPGPSEQHDWYWLFQYQAELEPLDVPSQLLPQNKSQARVLRKVFRDCGTPTARRDRYQHIVEDVVKSKRGEVTKLTADDLKKWGTKLVVKADPLPIARQSWRDLDINPPPQAKVESVLDQVNRLVRGDRNYPPEVVSVLRKLVDTFRDNRHLMVVVDDAGIVQGLLVRRRQYWGVMDEYRTRDRGKRGARGTQPYARWFTSLLPHWEVCDTTEDLVSQALDFKLWKRAWCTAFPPYGRADKMSAPNAVVMPNASQAERLINGTTHYKLAAVPVVSVQRFLNAGLSIEGRHWEDVADLVVGEDDLREQLGRTAFDALTPFGVTGTWKAARVPHN